MNGLSLICILLVAAAVAWLFYEVSVLRKRVDACVECDDCVDECFENFAGFGEQGAPSSIRDAVVATEAGVGYVESVPEGAGDFAHPHKVAVSEHRSHDR